MTALGPTLRMLAYLRPEQVARRFGARVTEPWYRSPLYEALCLAPRRQLTLRHRPPRPWPGDPESGRRILAGRIRLIGRERDFGAAPDWNPSDEPLLWRFHLHYFDWLDDLAAIGEAAHARALVSHWMAGFPRPDGLAWHPYPLSLRVYTWLARGDFLLDGADDGFRRDFLTSVDRQARHLERRLERDVGGNHLIKNLKAVIAARLCLGSGDAGTPLAWLEKEVAHQVLTDGCHYELSPAYHLQVLRDLLDVADLLPARPTWLDVAIARMAGALAFFRHGDGGLALFNDGEVGETSLLRAVEERLGGLPDAPPALEAAGYHRLTGGNTVVLFDTARAAPDDLPGHAHADMLSFELSHGPNRIVVNGGTYAYQDAEWRNRLRGTAAHSTVVVDDLDSAEVFGAFRLGRRPREVTFNGSQGYGGRTVVGRHDGYRHLGLIHRRRLKLSPDGGELSAEDRMEAFDGTAPAGHRMTARFHLHPDVVASEEKNGSIRLTLPTGSVWLFSAKEQNPSLEDSIYAPRFYEKHPTRQIVLRSPAGPRDLLSWRFTRQA